jgi:hypothetical protein
VTSSRGVYYSNKFSSFLRTRGSLSSVEGLLYQISGTQTSPLLSSLCCHVLNHLLHNSTLRHADSRITKTYWSIARTFLRIHFRPSTRSVELWVEVVRWLKEELPLFGALLGGAQSRLLRGAAADVVIVFAGR